MTEALSRIIASVPPAGSGSNSDLLVPVVLLALLIAAGALAGGIAAIWALVAELLGSMFASVRALLVIGLLFFCIIVIALGSVDDAGRGIGLLVPVAGSLG